MDVVEKFWGKEVVIVNCDEYCGKILVLNGGYSSSYHCHEIKQETFYCLRGSLNLVVDGVTYVLDSNSEPITIYPGNYHCFSSDCGADILEISTKHSDSDVYREKESYAL